MPYTTKYLLRIMTSVLFCTSAIGGLIDPNATPETQALFENLKRIPADKILFGHQHTTCYGIGWSGGLNRSDVKKLTGSHAAVYGWDMGHKGTDQMERLIIRAYKRGGINTISWHMGNLTTGGGSHHAVKGSVAKILPGGEFHDKLNNELDQFADFAKSLKTGGTLVPIIFRPWHEHTGGWFWWGSGACTEEEFNALWRYTVQYLRDKKKVNNLIYAFSPSGRTFNNVEEFETNRFPGYEYMDVIGFDEYAGAGETGVFDNRCAIISRLAKKHGKVAALTEFGYRDGLTTCTNPNWFMDFLKELKETPDAGGIAWMLTWRNEDENHFWIPYKGQLNEEDFKRFYADPMTVFETDLPDMYKMPKGK
jgi:mannan endo-1,4-beta-mannosidase